MVKNFPPRSLPFRNAMRLQVAEFAAGVATIRSELNAQLILLTSILEHNRKNYNLLVLSRIHLIHPKLPLMNWKKQLLTDGNGQVLVVLFDVPINDSSLSRLLSLSSFPVVSSQYQCFTNLTIFPLIFLEAVSINLAYVSLYSFRQCPRHFAFICRACHGHHPGILIA